MNKKEKMGSYKILKCLLETTAPHVGDSFLQVTCNALSKLLKAERVFIARSIDTPIANVKVLASNTDMPEVLNLKGTPCDLIYHNRNGLVLISEKMYQNFNSNYIGFESFVGIALYDNSICIGHIAVLSTLKILDEKLSKEIITLFSKGVESEIKILLLEERLKYFMSS